MASESHKTVYLALAANAGIAVAKFAGGAISGSTAMLAEGAHSIADTTNQLFLLASLSLAEREPDVDHPFGYGKERFFWSFMAAVFIFVSGALFSIYEGVHRMLSGEAESGGVGVAFAVLAVAAVLEGTSLIRATRQTRGEAQRRRQPFARHLKVSRDPTTKTVVFEDSAAVAGLFVAAIGLGLTAVTGSAIWDGLASVCIGVMLAVVAFFLGRDTKNLLIGSAALPEEREALERVFAEHEGVDELIELLTMALGPNSLLVAARIDVAPELDSDAVEALASELDEQLRDAVPEVGQVFLDPTKHRGVESRDGRSARADAGAR
jgi:cation diffusion facilitator family transporter